MRNAKIVKIIAGCIASVSIIGGIYFTSNNREKADNTTVIESNERSIVKDGNEKISSDNDNLVKEENKTNNISDKNNKGDINNNINSSVDNKENDNTSKTENQKENIDDSENKNDTQSNKNEEVPNNNINSNMVLDIQDITPQINNNNGQASGNGSNSNENIPSTEEEQVSGSDSYIAEIEQLIFQKVNEERVSAGLSPLNYNSTMEHYARLKSKDMGDRGYFDHADPEGKYITEQMKADGVSYRAWGENIAYISGASGNSALADRFMTNWMNSSGHRANILSTNFTSMGVGVYRIGNTYYATQEFYK